MSSHEKAGRRSRFEEVVGRSRGAAGSHEAVVERIDRKGHHEEAIAGGNDRKDRLASEVVLHIGSLEEVGSLRLVRKAAYCRPALADRSSDRGWVFELDHVVPRKSVRECKNMKEWPNHCTLKLTF